MNLQLLLLLQLVEKKKGVLDNRIKDKLPSLILLLFLPLLLLLVFNEEMLNPSRELWLLNPASTKAAKERQVTFSLVFSCWIYL